MQLLMQLCYFNFLLCGIELFCQTVVSLDLYRNASSSYGAMPYRLSKPTVLENPIKLYDANVQKYQFKKNKQTLKQF